MSLEYMWGNFMTQIAFLILAFLSVSYSSVHMDYIGKKRGHKTIILHGVQRGLFVRCPGITPQRHICKFPYIFQFINYIYVFIYLIVSVFDSFIIWDYDVAWNNARIMAFYALIILIVFIFLKLYVGSSKGVKRKPKTKKVAQNSTDSKA